MTLCNVFYRPAASSLAFSALFSAESSLTALTRYQVRLSGLTVLTPVVCVSTTSDRRLKKNIVDSSKGLAEINQLRVTNFEYRLKDEIDMSEFPLANDPKQVVLGGGQEGKLQTGVIAQEVESVIPECINVSAAGAKTVQTDPIMWAMVNAIKELSTKNDELAAEIASLKSQINN